MGKAERLAVDEKTGTADGFNFTRRRIDAREKSVLSDKYGARGCGGKRTHVFRNDIGFFRVRSLLRALASSNTHGFAFSRTSQNTSVALLEQRIVPESVFRLNGDIVHEDDLPKQCLVDSFSQNPSKKVSLPWKFDRSRATYLRHRPRPVTCLGGLFILQNLFFEVDLLLVRAEMPCFARGACSPDR